MKFSVPSEKFDRQNLPGIRSVIALAVALILLVPGAIAGGLAPHVAHYTMKLLSARSGSNIESVGGDMLVRWDGDCVGWTMTNRTVFDVGYTGGDRVRIAMDATTWESAPGDRYTFLVRTRFNEKESDRIEGTARLGGNSPVANFISPVKKQIALPRDTILPTQHTKTVLASAGGKPRIVRANVFDGFTFGGAQFVNAIIGGRLAQRNGSHSAFPELRQLPAWTVNLASFSTGKADAEPDSEISLKIFANGIAERMDMDFGDFRVRGDLKKVNIARPPACK